MISREEVEALGRLARLKLGKGEVESLQKDISNILEYVGQLSAAEIPDTARAKIAPAHQNVMRADAPRLGNDPLAGKEAALRAAFPAAQNGYAVVRQIIQKDA